MSSHALPTYFLSHGGGPWPYVQEPRRSNYVHLENFLIALRPQLRPPVRAVLVVSAHWEERGFAVSSAAHPGMEFDYYGFPDDLYRIRYAAPGSPAVATRVRDLLAGGGLPARLDEQRGFDHGTFSLMKVLAPEEELPVVQLSLDAGLDPAAHLRAGELLAPLRREGVVIIGSGFSYHNFAIRDARAATISGRFDAWLQQTLVEAEPAQRTDRLLHWEQAPAARSSHPREEHLIPLMVAVGAARDEPGACIYHETGFMQWVTASSFRFGSVSAR